MPDPLIPNTQRNEIRGKIGNREFVLVPSFENIQAVESQLQRTFLKISTEFMAEKPGFSFSEIVSVIFIAQKDPKLSYNKIGELVTKHGISGPLKMVGEFIKTALQGTEAEEVKEDDGGNLTAEDKQ